MPHAPPLYTSDRDSESGRDISQRKTFTRKLAGGVKAGATEGRALLRGLREEGGSRGMDASQCLWLEPESFKACVWRR